MSIKAKVAIWCLMLALTAVVIGLPFLFWAGLLPWEGRYPLRNAIIWWVIFGSAMGWFWYLLFRKAK